MPIQIPEPGNGLAVCDAGLSLSAEARSEAWAVAFDQCADHAETMALWSEAWSRWNSPVARARWNNRDVVRMAEAARRRSLQELAQRTAERR